MIEPITPENGKTVSLLTDLQRRFIADEEGRKNQIGEVFDYLNVKVQGEDNTCPRGVLFSWKGDSASSEWRLEISVSKDFSPCYTVDCESDNITLYNFPINQRFFWRVSDQNGNISPIFCFFTEDMPPRWIRVPGLTNIRDIGGWKTRDGHRIRQGMIYRGVEMDHHHEISEEGKKVLLNDLKIKTDLDLRASAVGRIAHSPLGRDTVDFKLLPCKPYGEFFDDDSAEENRKIFQLFTCPSQYPIYMHCWAGADRTGAITLLLMSVLGVPEEDMLLDYELTSLGIYGVRTRNCEAYELMETASNRFGEDHEGWSEKSIRYLSSIGLTESDFKMIRDILLEPLS